MTGLSLMIVPFSWAFGYWHRKDKYLYAIGPFRVVFHTKLRGWKFDV